LTATVPLHDKAALLEYEPILTCANKLRPGINIVGGSVPQDFNLETRIVSLQFLIGAFSLSGFLKLLKYVCQSYCYAVRNIHCVEIMIKKLSICSKK